MYYQYRWIYAALIAGIVFFISYQYDIQPTYACLIKSQEIQKQLTRQLGRYHLKHNRINHSHEMKFLRSDKNTDQLSVIPFLSALEHESGVRIHLLNHEIEQKIGDANAVKINLIVYGSFQQIYLFINRLEAFSVLILNFNYHQTNFYQNSLGLELFIIKNNFKQRSPSRFYRQRPAHNPFCLPIHLSIANYRNDLSLLQNAPLEKIKMIGYIEKGNQHRAIVSLENQTIFSLNDGNKIGKEQGIVKEISPHHLSLLLPNQKWVVLQM